LIAADRAGGEDPELLLAAGRQFENSADWQRARETYTRIAVRFPDAPQAIEGAIGAARALYESGQIGPALAEAEAELQEPPTIIDTAVDAEYTSTIEVLRMIHARVTLEISGRTIVFGHELKGPVKIWLDGDTVMHQPGNAEPAPLREAAGVQDRLAA
jgi:hypothetical protein